MDRLTRQLNSIGKTIFIKYYEQFKALTKEECIKYLILKKISNYNGAYRRCYNVKAIFEINMQAEALKIILSSKRIDKNIILKTNKLLMKER